MYNIHISKDICGKLLKENSYRQITIFIVNTVWSLLYSIAESLSVLYTNTTTCIQIIGQNWYTIGILKIQIQPFQLVGFVLRQVFDIFVFFMITFAIGMAAIDTNGSLFLSKTSTNPLKHLATNNAL